MTIRIRPGRPDDLTQIADYTRETFAWGDYVAESFVEWLDDEQSLVMVAAGDDDSAVGLARVVMLSDREAWLHAARVRPDMRRAGVGTLLNQHGCDWARGRGAQVARLLIEDWNEAPQSQVEKQGFRRVAQWASAFYRPGGPVDPSTNGGSRVPGDERLGPGSAAEIEPAWIAWSTSELAHTGRQLYPIGWHFRKMKLDDLVAASRARELWHSPSGWVIGQQDDEGLFVPWIMTTDLDVERLVRALIDRAQRLEVERVRAMIPRVNWLVAAMAHVGFEIEPSTVWAKSL